MEYRRHKRRNGRRKSERPAGAAVTPSRLPVLPCSAKLLNTAVETLSFLLFSSIHLSCLSPHPSLLHGSHAGQHAARKGVLLPAFLVAGEALSAANLREELLQKIAV